MCGVAWNITYKHRSCIQDPAQVLLFVRDVSISLFLPLSIVHFASIALVSTNLREPLAAHILLSHPILDLLLRAYLGSCCCLLRSGS